MQISVEPTLFSPSSVNVTGTKFGKEKLAKAFIGAGVLCKINLLLSICLKGSGNNRRPPVSVLASAQSEADVPEPTL